MANTTMGQRIAERRKLLNLSQEAFGEKMGVSRQAISKWEADAAIPEIDKLIAMSKLFSVSVGWLLGTETDTVPTGQTPEFTEEQLRLVEQIAERYAKPSKRDRTLLAVIGCCVVTMLLVCLVTFVTYSSYVNQELAGLYSMFNILNSGYDNIDDRLGQVTDRLDELAASERLLAEYSVEVEAWEDMTGATVRFSGVPNNTRAQDQVWLSVRLDGEEVANAMCTLDGSAYVAAVELSAADGYSYYLQAVHVGGDSSQQVLEADSVAMNLASALTGRVYTEVWQAHWNLDDSTVTVNLNVDRKDPQLFNGTDDVWSQMDLVVFLNGEEIHRSSMLDDFRGVTYTTEDGTVHSVAPDSCSLSRCFVVPQLVERDQILLMVEYSGVPGAVISQDVACLEVRDGGIDLTNYAPADFR